MPYHHPPHLPHGRHGRPPPPGLPPDPVYVRALRELVRNCRGVISPEILIDYAGRVGVPPELVDFLGSACADLEPTIAVEEMAHHEVIAAHRRLKRLEALAEAGAAVTVLWPLPVHILDRLTRLERVTVYEPDNHRLPPHASWSFKGRVIADPHEALCAVEQSDVVVFDGRFCGADLLVRRVVASVCDLRILPPGAKLFVHLRGKIARSDMPASAELAARCVRI